MRIRGLAKDGLTLFVGVQLLITWVKRDPISLSLGLWVVVLCAFSLLFMYERFFLR